MRELPDTFLTESSWGSPMTRIAKFRPCLGHSPCGFPSFLFSSRKVHKHRARYIHIMLEKGSHWGTSSLRLNAIDDCSFLPFLLSALCRKVVTASMPNWIITTRLTQGLSSATCPNTSCVWISLMPFTLGIYLNILCMWRGLIRFLTCWYTVDPSNAINIIAQLIFVIRWSWR